MKFETARNHFLSDVFVAVTVVVECLSSLFTVTQTPTSGGIFRLGGINDHTIKRLFHLSQCIKICRAKCKYKGWKLTFYFYLIFCHNLSYSKFFTSIQESQFLSYEELNENKPELSEAHPFQSLFGLFMLSSCGRTKDLVRKIYFGISSITLALKFNLSTEFFSLVERTFLVRRVRQKLAFLTHLIAYA